MSKALSAWEDIKGFCLIILSESSILYLISLINAFYSEGCKLFIFALSMFGLFKYLIFDVVILNKLLLKSLKWMN